MPGDSSRAAIILRKSQKNSEWRSMSYSCRKRTNRSLSTSNSGVLAELFIQSQSNEKGMAFAIPFFVFRMSYLRAAFFSFAFLNLAMVVSLTSSIMILRNSRVSEKHFGPIVIPSPIVFNVNPSTITEFPNSNIFVIYFPPFVSNS